MINMKNLLDIILSIGGIFMGVLALLDKIYQPTGIAIMLFVILLIYFSQHVSKIEEHDIRINKLDEKIKIYERLSKIEAEIDLLKRRPKNG